AFPGGSMELGIPSRQSPLRPAGRPEGVRFRALQLGARALQSTPPLRGFGAYLVGFHPAGHEPSMQTGAHHYCKVAGDALVQCVRLRANAVAATLLCLDHVLSGSPFATLQEGAKADWHRRTSEARSRQLVPARRPAGAAQQPITRLSNCYGKTWRTRHTG